MRSIALLPLAALLLNAPPAAAGEGCGQSAEAAVLQMFDSADADGDGALTPTEYGDAGLHEFGVSFEESDLDGDGVTSDAEYLELYRTHHPPVEGSEI